jgi:hypothetical protein
VHRVAGRLESRGRSALRQDDGGQFQADAGVRERCIGAPHAWDLRADWLSPDPTTGNHDPVLRDLRDFPAWFFNLPPDSDSWPALADRPPGATVSLRVHGFLRAAETGVLQIDTDPT